MIVVRVRNAHEALLEGVNLLWRRGRKEQSRAGDVLVAPAPVTTVYSFPLERVVFWSERDANPFFHLMEALWMLYGRNDVQWLVRFNSNMISFSDDGVSFHGAYGYRWRQSFGVDQLPLLVRLLNNNPNTRRAVLQMWHSPYDLHTQEEGAPLDIPCNTHIYFSNRDGYLDMTVCCRSNDIIWGAYGSNIVHFSILQEYVATLTGLKVGVLHQISNNYHVYTDVMQKKVLGLLTSTADDRRKQRARLVYENNGLEIIPLISNLDTFDQELRVWMNEEREEDFVELPFDNVFLKHANTMRYAYLHWKRTHDAAGALDILDALPPDWDFTIASVEWMKRRLKG